VAENKISLGLVSGYVLISLYCIAVFTVPLLKKDVVTRMKFAGGNNPLQREAAVPEKRKGLDFYLQGTRSRQIFVVAQEDRAALPQVAKVQAGELLKDINLTGVFSGSDPQAVLENKKTQKTYYVTIGQSIEGFLVEDIQEGKVMLSYQGEKFELYL